MTEPSRSPAIRHRLPDRLFHWVMALCVVVLAATAFLPRIGVRFDWVPLHWMFGVLLCAAILFHLYRVFAAHDVRQMGIGAEDVREAAGAAFGRYPEGLGAAKYDAFQKGYHLAAALSVLVLAGTGLVMLAKIDTVFWRRDPSILSDPTWGVIYVLHGIAALVILFLVIVHVYFGLLPEHREFLKAMLTGQGPEHSRKGAK